MPYAICLGGHHLPHGTVGLTHVQHHESYEHTLTRAPPRHKCRSRPAGKQGAVWVATTFALEGSPDSTPWEEGLELPSALPGSGA